MRALVSVSDKTGLVPFVKGLVAAGFEIVSTGGTKRALDDAGLPTIGIEEVTGFPEIMDGRVKTLHPKVHAGLLARRDRADDMATLAEKEITPIDLVAVNLYPFKQTIEDQTKDLADAIENIDIGGPSMIRAAAKNYRDVTVAGGIKDGWAHQRGIAGRFGREGLPPHRCLRRRDRRLLDQADRHYAS